MANVEVAIAMTPTYLPFERPPDRAALWSAIPRGLRGFVIPSATLTAKPVNDTETFVLSGTLGPNFAYILAEISVRLAQDRAQDWEREYSLNLQNFYQGNVALSQNWNFPFSTIGLGSLALGNGPAAVRMPMAPITAPRGTAGVLISITGFNDAAAVAAAGVIACYINFWEFDLEQARKYPINAPLPTHSR